ncbi:MAG: hypothetical protein BroJett040_06660 [Oligoflexia bacterium]|nr:MAG: hypothetical protein BroJett040_06660 [Oligoflexia bacterium]
MKNIFSILVLGILTVGWMGCATNSEKKSETPATPAASSSQPMNHQMSLKDLSSQSPQTGPEEMIQWFEKCSIECKGEDQKISSSFAKGYRILFELSTAQPVYEKLTKAQKKKAEEGKDYIRKAFLTVLETQTDADMIMTAWGTLADPESDYKLADKKLKPAVEKTIKRLSADEATKKLSQDLANQYKARFQIK